MVGGVRFVVVVVGAGGDAKCWVPHRHRHRLPHSLDARANLMLARADLTTSSFSGIWRRTSSLLRRSAAQHHQSPARKQRVNNCQTPRDRAAFQIHWFSPRIKDSCLACLILRLQLTLRSARTLYRWRRRQRPDAVCSILPPTFALSQAVTFTTTVALHSTQSPLGARISAQ